MHDCEKLREDIWEAVEVGEMPDSLMARIGDCVACRRELRRAESAMVGFGAIRSMDAPDCAGAVMARLENAADKGHAVWAYALGVVLVIGIAATVAGLHRARVGAPCSDMAGVRNRPPVEQPSLRRPEVARDSAKPEVEDGKAVGDARQRRRVDRTPGRVVYHQPKKTHVPGPVRGVGDVDGPEKVSVVDSPPENQGPAVVTNPPEQKTPRMMIIVTSDITRQNDPSEAVFGYGYTQTNPETGDTTKCSVERSGESVEIYMDMRPGSKKAPGEGNWTMRARLAFNLVFAVLLLSVCSVAGADVFDSPVWQQEMDLIVVDGRLGLILTQVIDPTGTDYSLDRDLEWVMLPSLMVKGTPRQNVFGFVLKACGLTYKMEGDRIVVVAKEGYKNVWLTHVNIDLKEVALGRAVDCLFRGLDINYTIDPDAIDLRVGRWECIDVTLYEAFDALMKSAGAVSSNSMGAVHISPASKSTPALAFVGKSAQVNVTVEPGEGDPWARRTDIDVKDAQLGMVAEKLLKGTGFNFSINDDAVYLAVRALKLEGVTLRKAFDALMKQAGAVCIDKGGVVSIRGKSPLPEPKDPVCLNWKDIPLPDALKSLFRGTGFNYTLESDIGGLRVTANLENVSFQSVLKTLLDSGGLTYRIDGRMYHIYGTPPATAEMKPKQIELKLEIYTKVSPTWSSKAMPEVKPGAYCTISVDTQDDVRKALTDSGAELVNSITITTLDNTPAQIEMKTTIHALPKINADKTITFSVDAKTASEGSSVSQRLAKGESLLWIMPAAPEGTQVALIFTPSIAK